MRRTAAIPNNGRTKAGQLAYSEEHDTADYDDGLLDGGEEPCTEGDWRGRFLWAGLVALLSATVAGDGSGPPFCPMRTGDCTAEHENR
jgi:hypothetical protein